MNKYIVLIGTFMLILVANINAQLKTPDVSPRTYIEQTVGLTKISVDYSRPSLNGRSIFTDIIPYSEFWRVGANQATKITFNAPVYMEGINIPKGEYSILAVPEKHHWSISIYPYTSSNWNKYVDATPIASFRLPTSISTKSVESFNIMFDKLTLDGFKLILQWGFYEIKMNVNLDEKEKIKKKIDTYLAGPSSFDYFKAASYLYYSKQDLNKALVLIQKSINPDKPTFFQKRMEALILAELQRYPEAIKSAEQSILLSKEIGNQNLVRLNNKSIQAWKANIN